MDDFGSGSRGGSHEIAPGLRLEQEYDDNMQKEEFARQRHEELKSLEGFVT